MIIDNEEFTNIEVVPAEFIQQLHLLCHLVAEAPEVDDVAAAAWFGSLLDQRHRTPYFSIHHAKAATRNPARDMRIIPNNAWYVRVGQLFFRLRVHE